MGFFPLAETRATQKLNLGGRAPPPPTFSYSEGIMQASIWPLQINAYTQFHITPGELARFSLWLDPTTIWVYRVGT